ncbi:MAG: aminopeptidase [Bacilli bacterium]|nr:aminopeptidase [Bacilli bacterium]
MVIVLPYLRYHWTIDENASCHLALGNGYNEQLNEEELNSSKNHIDFMIGTSDLEIEAETCKVFPLILLLFLNYCR